MPWLFRWSMIVLGSIVALMAAPIALHSRTKLEIAAGFFMMEAGIFLFVLGLLPVESPFHLIMALMFFVMITPIALFTRLLGKRPLSLNFNPQAETYWIDLVPPGSSAASMNNQF